MDKLDVDKVRTFYENVDEIWNKDDLWHLYSKTNIENYISRHKFEPNAHILNAGSGGSTYGLLHRMHHVDIVKDKIECYSEHTVGSIENLPFTSHLFTDVICVGSVLNYCDAMAAITELSRVLKAGGKLILEFESTWGFEHLRDKGYKTSAVIVEVSYSGKTSRQWIYSPQYIQDVLKQAGFHMVKKFYFHYLSGLHYSRYRNENAATVYTKFDALCRRIPYLRKHSNNVIYTCTKL